MILSLQERWKKFLICYCFWSLKGSYLQLQISFFALLEIHANLRIDKSAFEEKEPKNLHQKAEIKIRKSYHVKNLSQSDAHMYCNISIMVR